METVDLVDPVGALALERFGVPYLYPYQRLVVANVLDAIAGQERLDQLVILPTGAGKSLCFQLPAAFCPGLTVVVFPLLGLMADQARRLGPSGLGIATLKGGLVPEERAAALGALRSGSAKLAIANPESLRAPDVRRLLAEAEVSHFVIDEAHCAAEWGDSFRPAYLALGEAVEEASPRVVTAFTATASPPVLARVAEILFRGRAYGLIAGAPDRPNIRYEVRPVLSMRRALREAAAHSRRPAIVFASSRAGVELLAEDLRATVPGLDCRFYHAGLDKAERAVLEAWFLASGDGLLCATCAYVVVVFSLLSDILLPRRSIMLGIYCRTSKDERDDKTIDQQITAGKAFASKNNFDEFDIYPDPDVTGSKEDLSNRPEMIRLLNDIKAGRVKTVWVWEQSRLARNDMATSIILSDFQKANVAYYIGDKYVDLKNATDSFTTKLLALVAEYERTLIVARTTRGLHTAIDKGNRGYGRFYGYRKTVKDEVTKRYIWEPVQEELDTVRRIYDLYLSGNSLRTVSRIIYGEGRITKTQMRSRWQKLHRLLSHIEYTGQARKTDGTLTDCKPYPIPVVTLEEYKKVQGLLKNWSDQNAIKTKYSENLCTGIISCGHCGQKYYYYITHVSSTRKTQYEYYKHQEPPHLPKCGQKPKNLHKDKIEKLTEFVYFLSMLSSTDLSLVRYELLLSTDEERRKMQEDLSRVEKEIERTENRLGRAKSMALASDEAVSIWAKDIQEIQDEIKELSKARDNLLAEIRNTDMSERLETHSQRRVKSYQSSSVSVRRRFLKDILQAVVKDNQILYSTLITNRHFLFDLESDLPPIVDEVLEYAKQGQMLPPELEKHIAERYESTAITDFQIPVIKFAIARYFTFLP